VGIRAVAVTQEGRREWPADLPSNEPLHAETSRRHAQRAKGNIVVQRRSSEGRSRKHAPRAGEIFASPDTADIEYVGTVTVAPRGV
jgi:hypothetical protein